jgi:hypothetical protein
LSDFLPEFAARPVCEFFLTCQLTSGGNTPITVCSTALRITVRPITFGSLPNRRCHKPLLMTTTSFCPGLPSSGVKVRPSMAFTPSTEKRLSVVICAGTSSGSPSLERVLRVSLKAAMPSKTLFCSCQSKKFAGLVTFCSTESLTYRLPELRRPTPEKLTGFTATRQ